jgi:hypothetical protein
VIVVLLVEIPVNLLEAARKTESVTDASPGTHPNHNFDEQETKQHRLVETDLNALERNRERSLITIMWYRLWSLKPCLDE